MPLGTALKPGQLYDSNGPMVRALLEAAGVQRVETARASDDDDAMAAVLTRALDSQLLLTTGGASVGDYDRVRPALEAAGCEFFFHRVRIKPGKPVAFGKIPSGLYVLMLPGNPVSAFVTFHIFADRVLRALRGAPPRPLRKVRLATGATHRTGRTEFVRAVFDPDGRARPFARQTSGALHDLAQAEVLLELPGDVAALPEDAEVSAIVL